MSPVPYFQTHQATVLWIDSTMMDDHHGGSLVTHLCPMKELAPGVHLRMQYVGSTPAPSFPHTRSKTSCSSQRQVASETNVRVLNGPFVLRVLLSGAWYSSLHDQQDGSMPHVWVCPCSAAQSYFQPQSIQVYFVAPRA